MTLRSFHCIYCSAPIEPMDTVCTDAACVAKWQGVQMHELTVANILADQRAAERRVIAEHDRRPFNILVTAGAEFKVITEMARAMEAEGDEPVLTWFRDENDVIVGVKLVGHLSRETVSRAPELQR